MAVGNPTPHRAQRGASYDRISERIGKVPASQFLSEAPFIGGSTIGVLNKLATHSVISPLITTDPAVWRLHKLSFLFQTGQIADEEIKGSLQYTGRIACTMDMKGPGNRA